MKKLIVSFAFVLIALTSYAMHNDGIMNFHIFSNVYIGTDNGIVNSAADITAFAHNTSFYLCILCPIIIAVSFK